MSLILPEVLLGSVSDLIASRMGLSFPPDRWQELERGLRSAAREKGSSDPESWLRGLIDSPWSLRYEELLAAHLTVGETYFFRDGDVLAALESQVLPELIYSRDLSTDPIRVWSAGCCTGEESYTLAMMLDSLLPGGVGERWTVLGTDINPLFLERARQGVYREWSFRGGPPWIRDRYFRCLPDGCLEIAPALRARVRFAPLNLAEGGYPSPTNGTDRLDLILCRNVLMYFRPDRAAQVGSQLSRCLRDGGHLAVAPAESSIVSTQELGLARLPAAALFRRSEAEAQRGAFHSWNGARSVLPVSPWLSETELQLVPQPPAWAPLRGSPFDTAPAPANTATRLEPPRAAQSLQPSFERAAAMYGAGRYSEAVEELTDYLGGAEPSPLFSESLRLLVQSLANLGRRSSALEWCKKAISQDRLSPDLHYLYATLLQEQGQLEEAARAHRQVLYLDGGFALAHFALGNLARQQGKPVEARRHYVNAIAVVKELDPAGELSFGEGMTAGALVQLLQPLAPL